MIRLPSKRERKEKIKLKKTEGFPNFDFNLFFMSNNMYVSYSHLLLNSMNNNFI
jgi:hypothetical protein